MISVNQFIYVLGLGVVFVLGYFLLVEFMGYLDKRKERKVKSWNAEILKKKK